MIAAFRDAVAAAGLDDRVAVRPSGCLDACPRGPVAVVYEGPALAKPPGKLERLWKKGVWYGPLVARDVGAIVEGHLHGGVPLARCRF